MTRHSPWGVFLDRDGTLVPNAHHPTRPGQLRLYARTGQALRLLREHGARLAVVSNQSAVARGLMDARGLRVMDRRLRELLAAESVRLDRTDYCPHHPEFTGPCACRKPAPEMLTRSMTALRLRPQRVVFVGDSVSDMEAGRAAGVLTALVLTGNGRRALPQVTAHGLADGVFGGILGAARWGVRRLGS